MTLTHTYFGAICAAYLVIYKNGQKTASYILDQFTMLTTMVAEYLFGAFSRKLSQVMIVLIMAD